MIRSIEKFNYLIGNKTRDLPACSIVSHKKEVSPKITYLILTILLPWTRNGFSWNTILRVNGLLLSVVEDVTAFTQHCMYSKDHGTKFQLIICNVHLQIFWINNCTKKSSFIWTQVTRAIRLSKHTTDLISLAYRNSTARVRVSLPQ
jgi:hypothetical protein